MAASKFFEVLPILRDGDEQVGVCAMGPIGTGDTLLWMRAWAWQQDGDKIAAAAGSAGEQVEGAHVLDAEDRPPFAHPRERWMVQMALEPVSADFTDQKPVEVQAVALVENGGDRDIVQWGQAVMLRTPGGSGSGPGHPHEY
jgi:hypothetical protein